MSRLWPHPPYAEDQPYSHLILSTHVFTRAVQAGSLIGTGVGTSLFLIRHYNLLPSLIKARVPPSTLASTILRSAGVGAVVATGLLVVGLPMRMRGREEIEWQDRSWRLLENKGQLECDDWTYPGMAVGLAGVIGSGSAKALGWRGVLGGAGVGSVVGMMGYMAWRYGLKGGKFEEKEL